MDNKRNEGKGERLPLVSLDMRLSSVEPSIQMACSVVLVEPSGVHATRVNTYKVTMYCADNRINIVAPTLIERCCAQPPTNDELQSIRQQLERQCAVITGRRLLWEGVSLKWFSKSNRLEFPAIRGLRHGRRDYPIGVRCLRTSYQHKNGVLCVHDDLIGFAVRYVDLAKWPPPHPSSPQFSKVDDLSTDGLVDLKGNEEKYDKPKTQIQWDRRRSTHMTRLANALVKHYGWYDQSPTMIELVRMRLN